MCNMLINTSNLEALNSKVSNHYNFNDKENLMRSYTFRAAILIFLAHGMIIGETSQTIRF